MGGQEILKATSGWWLTRLKDTAADKLACGRWLSLERVAFRPVLGSDPEWKYVNLRRYFIHLEPCIDEGTPWAVFEPNSEGLWANVRRTIQDFLLNEWQSGALLGDKPEKALL